MDNNVINNLINAVAAYAEDGAWNDSDMIDALVAMGVTHEDFIRCGKGEFVKEYFEETSVSVPEISSTLTREQIEQYLKGQGHPQPDVDGTLDEFMYGGEQQAHYDEAVLNNYALPDVNRWFHLMKVMGIDLSFETAIKIDSALHEADLETMELNLPEERLAQMGVEKGEPPFIVLRGSMPEVKAQILRAQRARGPEAYPLTKIKAADLDITDCVKLFAELRSEIDMAKVLLLDRDGLFYDLTRPEDENILLTGDELRALIGQYVELNPDPLMSFIEREVPFRLEFLHDLEVTPEERAAIVEAVKDHNDVMFDYDRFDEFLGEEYEKVHEKAPEISESVDARRKMFIFDDELTVIDDNVTVNGYLWAVDALVDRLPFAEDMENINFFAEYNVLTGAVTLTATYDTPSADGELNKVLQVSLSEEETAELISSMEAYCKSNWSLNCVDYVNDVRSYQGLAPLVVKTETASLDEQIRNADSVKATVSDVSKKECCEVSR